MAHRTGLACGWDSGMGWGRMISCSFFFAMGLVVKGSFPFTLYKNQEFSSPNYQAKPPIRRSKTDVGWFQRETQRRKKTVE